MHVRVQLCLFTILHDFDLIKKYLRNKTRLPHKSEFHCRCEFSKIFLHCVLISRRIKKVLMRVYSPTVKSFRRSIFIFHEMENSGEQRPYSACMLKLFLPFNRQVTSQSQFLIPSTFSSIFISCFLVVVALPPSYFVLETYLLDL